MVSKPKKHRLPTGYTQSEIVRLLHKKENQRLRSMDIQEKIGISKPVLYSHLKKLEKEGTIFSKKEGREMYYMLSKNMYKILERRIDVLASNYNLFTNNELAFLDYSKNKKFYSEIGDKFNVMMIYSTLKSIETGENWIDAIDIKEFVITALYRILSSIYPDKIPDELNDFIESRDFKKIRALLKKTLKKRLDSNLKHHYEILQKMYPIEFEILQFSFNKPQLNWQKHYEEMNKKK